MIKYCDMDANSSLKSIRLSCNVLKIIACVIMLIDHVAFGIIHNYMIAHAMDILPETYTTLQNIAEGSDIISKASLATGIPLVAVSLPAALCDEAEKTGIDLGCDRVIKLSRTIFYNY